MAIPNGVTFELISTGPGVGWWSSPAQRAAAFDAEIERRIGEIRLRQAVEALTSAEEQRHQSRIRRAQPVQVPNGKGLLTVPEVAARLQVNRRTVARYIEEGVLKAARIGGKGPYRIKEGDLEKMLVPEKGKAVRNEELDTFISAQITPRGRR